MAIQILQEPTTSYPAYNDCYIRFKSNMNGNNKAVIRINELNREIDFVIFSNIDGVYSFNMVEVVKTMINKTKFRDALNLVHSPDTWGYSDTFLHHRIDMDIIVYADDNSETISKTYDFYKGVMQYGDTLHTNPYQIMQHSEGGVSYDLTYFEGFPFDFTLKQLGDGEKVRLKNINTGAISGEMSAFEPTGTPPFRIVLDKGYTNTTTSGFFPMFDITNRLDVMINGTAKTTINLKKKNNTRGVYLKWFNSYGSYSYWLFNEFYRSEINTSSMDIIGNNSTDFIYNDSHGKYRELGKQAVKGMRLKSKVDRNELKFIETLLTSPHVQLYSSHEPYVEGKWVDVTVTSKKITNVSKQHLHDFEVDIELPIQNTLTL